MQACAAGCSSTQAHPWGWDELDLVEKKRQVVLSVKCRKAGSADIEKKINVLEAKN